MNTDIVLASLVAALAVNEFVHIVFEIWGIRQKVQWLTARMDGKPHGNWPIRIDSLLKTIMLHTFLFFFVTGISMFIITNLQLSSQTVLFFAAIILITTYAYTTLGMDAYHTEIGRLINRYKRHE